MGLIKRIKDVANYYVNAMIDISLQLPKITSVDGAIKALKNEKIKDYYEVKKFLEFQSKKGDKNSYYRCGNVFYLGEYVKNWDIDFLKKASEIVSKTFHDKDGMIIAVYDNLGYKFYYVYHNGLNGTGDFADYMKSAADKLKDMTNNGAMFRTITDMFNDYVDDVADWLYVFRL